MYGRNSRRSLATGGDRLPVWGGGPSLNCTRVRTWCPAPSTRSDWPPRTRTTGRRPRESRRGQPAPCAAAVVPCVLRHEAGAEGGVADCPKGTAGLAGRPDAGERPLRTGRKRARTPAGVAGQGIAPATRRGALAAATSAAGVVRVATAAGARAAATDAALVHMAAGAADAAIVDVTTGITSRPAATGTATGAASATRGPSRQTRRRGRRGGRARGRRG